MNKLLGLLVGSALLAAPFISFASSTVTATAGTGATVSPAGVTIVGTGLSQVFTFGASRGYQESGVSIDGVSQGALGSFDFFEDGASHSISVSAVSSGSMMPFCSGPMAPGWQQGVAGGGCGGTGQVVAAGSTYLLELYDNNGKPADVGTAVCPFWFPGGCLKE